MNKLVRNTTPDHVCKYALLRLDKMRADGVYNEFISELQKRSVATDDGYFKYVELQKVGDNEESFAIKLKDIVAPEALLAYADGTEHLTGDKEFANEIRELAARAKAHPNRKIAD